MAVIGLGLLLCAGVVWGLPFLLDEREYVAVTPQPSPLFEVATIPLGGGDRACLDQAVIDEHSEEARFRVGTFERPPVPLELTLRGDGYQSTVRVPAEYADSELLEVPIPAPEGAVPVTICIRNLGQRRVALYASDDRTNSRSQARVNGERVPEDFVIVFYERGAASIAERLPASLERASAFRPLVTPWVLWPLLALFVVGVPLAIFGTLAGALPRRRG